VAALYVGGGLIATCFCWMAVSFYFFDPHKAPGVIG